QLARAAGKLDDAFATLETATNNNPGDAAVLQDLVELATTLGDHEAAARHLTALAQLCTGSRRGTLLLELADIYYDRIEDSARGREAMRAAAEAFGSGARHDTTLRMLATEAASNLAWNVAVDALAAVAPGRRTVIDVTSLATALQRAGRDSEAIALVEDATANHKFDDGGELLQKLRGESVRKSQLAKDLLERARNANSEDASAMREEARNLRDSVGDVGHTSEPGVPVTRVTRPYIARIKLVPAAARAVAAATADEAGWQSVSDPALRSPGAAQAAAAVQAEVPAASVTITGTPAETESAVQAAALYADRDRLIAAHRDTPDDAGVLLALLAHLSGREPELRRKILEETAVTGRGRSLAIALHELAMIARESHQPTHAAALWQRAHVADASYAPVWMPLADALVTADEISAARDLYEAVAASPDYDEQRRKFAAERSESLGRDNAIIVGEVTTSEPSQATGELASAMQLAQEGDLPAAIAAAERAAGSADSSDTAALELLEKLYFEANNVTAASEAIGRQLALAPDDARRSTLWRRRARMYRETLGRDAEAYRCLKEAHAFAPEDSEIAYQLRTAAMVRGEWALAASLIYREIAAISDPRERGALHLELALIFLERLDDEGQAQVNFEQALAFDPTIPAVKLPLARRYEKIERFAEAARFYEEAAASARAADRAGLIEAATRCRTAAVEATGEPGLAAQLDAAEAAGELDRARELARELWRTEPGHPAAYRLLANEHRASGDLTALSELTAIRASHTEVLDDRCAAWLAVARLAEEIGAYDQAATAYDRALAENPRHAESLDARGALAFKQGDFTKADTIYKQLLPGESVLGDDELALRRSLIAERLGRESDALGYAREAGRAAPGRRDVMTRIQELATRLHDLDTALGASRAGIDLIPLEDDDAKLAAQFALVELLRQAGDLEGATAQLERVLRDYPLNGRAIETLVDVHVARSDWTAATRYLYQLVPLAPSATERAERLYRLGEAVLVHLDDVDRADDVFLRASDLDPTHLPTLRRLLDVYWRADDPGAIVEVATELADRGALSNGQHDGDSLAHAIIAAALIGDTQLASRVCEALGEDAPRRITTALASLSGRTGRLQMASATTAIAELARRGVLDLAKIRGAAAGTPVAALL
ncbi:MAG: hypothetical protein AB7O24_05050, partial [Kofleriaceae bacterium]